MKKSLFALAGLLLLGASSAGAATVYFEKPASWENVYAYIWPTGTGQDGATATPFPALSSTEIDGHTLYVADTGNRTGGIIFLNRSDWNEQGKEQTADFKVIDGAVYSKDCVKDGPYMATVEGDQYIPNPEYTPAQTTDTGLYLKGTFNNWSNTHELSKLDDDTYTITVNFAKGTAFKIANSDWSTSYGGPQTENGATTSVSLNSENTLWNNSASSNLECAEDWPNVMLTFNTSTEVLTISDGTGELDIKWYAAWNLNDGEGWKFETEMEKQVEGTYKAVVTASATSGVNYFAVFQSINEPSFDKGIRYVPVGMADVTVTEEGVYAMQVGNAGAWVLEKNGEWTVVVDPTVQSNSKITFDYGNSTGEANILIDDTNDEDYSFKSYAMDEVEGADDDYTWSGELKATDVVKFNIHGTNYWYDPSKVNSMTDDHANGYLTIEYPLEEGDGTVTFDYTSNVTYVVNVTAKTVTLTLNNPPVVSMTVTNGDASSVHGLQAVAGETDMYELSHTLDVTSDDHIDFRIHDTRYECDYDNETAEADYVLYKLVEADTDVEAPAVAQALVGDTWKVRVCAKDGDQWVMFYKGDFPTAVSEIAAENGKATYFNLQGIQVSEPENGLYIVVKDGKAVKVLK